MSYQNALSIEEPKIHELETLVPNSDFAQSLCNQWRQRKSLSHKQWIWVEKLINEAKARKAEDVKDIDLTRLHDYFKQTGLKQPKIFIRIDDDRTLACKVAGGQAREPGVINLLVDNNWIGRVRLDGSLFLSRHARGVIKSKELVDAIDAFLADPEAAAKAYGLATHHCCFCGEDLTDERSTNAGYGPVCAKRYGLPWGAKPKPEEEG